MRWLIWVNVYNFYLLALILMDMQDTAMLTPVIVGILQAIKYVLPTSAKKFIPLIGIALGILVVYCLGEASSLKESVLL